jgi:hypothetical protein
MSTTGLQAYLRRADQLKRADFDTDEAVIYLGCLIEGTKRPLFIDMNGALADV